MTRAGIANNGRRMAASLVAAAVGAATAYFCQPWYHGNSAAQSVLITVFSVLAGFLLTAMTLRASTAIDRGANWREAYFHAQFVRIELRRDFVMLTLYLLIVALAFVDALAFGMAHVAEVWLERFTLFLSVIAFAGSIGIPLSLVRSQLHRLDRNVESRRQNDASHRNDDEFRRHAV